MPFAADFAAMHRLAGNPTMFCVPVRTSWTGVPAGYSYSADYDAYLNGSGTVWKPTISNLEAEDGENIAILPAVGSYGFDLTAGGLAVQSSDVVYIQAADKSTVEAAHSVIVNSAEYVVDELTPVPFGSPLWYRVMLRKK